MIGLTATVDNGRVIRGRSVAVGVSDRWKVTCDMLLVTCDFFFLQKVPERTTSRSLLCSASLYFI